MDLLEGIETRRSLRAFKPAPVPMELVEKILKAASRILFEMANSDISPNPDLPRAKVWPPELEKGDV
jgi:nitroreductase